jgi:outer membrane protein assembly factor BamB
VRLENTQYVLSNYSDEGSVSVLRRPNLLSPSDTARRIALDSTLKWTKERYVQKYRVQISYNDSFNVPWFDKAVVGNDSVNILMSRYNYNYFWHVRSEDSTGHSEWSNYRFYQTLLNVPMIDSSRAGNKKIRLYWQESDTQNLKHYHIYRNLTNSFPTGFGPIGVVAHKAGQVKYTYLDSGLTNFTTYYYWIKSVNNQSVKSQESIVDSNTTFNISPIAFINRDTAFENVGRNSRTKHYFMQTAAFDKDGWIDSTVWYIDDIRVSNDDSLKYKFRQGTTKVSAVVFDNDQASDTNTFYVHQLTYKKLFREGLINGVTLFDENNIFVSDTSLNSFNLGEVVCLDSFGNKKMNYLVNDKIRATPSLDYLGNMYFTNGVSLNSFSKSGAPLFGEIQLGGLSFVTPTIDSVLDRMYIGISNKKFFALDLKNKGVVKWDFTADAPIASSAVITAGRKLIFTDISGKLYGFDVSTSLMPRTGNPPKWKHFIPMDSILVSPSLDTMEKVIVGTTRGNLMKLELDSFGQVKINWSTNLFNKVTTSAVLDAYGHIYTATSDGKLHCIRSSDGSVLWSFNSGAPIISTPSISESNRIYFANIRGDVYSLDTGMNIMWYYFGKEKVIGHLVHINGATYIPSESGSLKVIFDKGINNDIKSIQSQITPRGKKQLNVPKPIWGTFQGNVRRTGLQDGVFKVVPDIAANEKSVVVYPNPCFGQFTVESLFGIGKIEFFDLSGKKIDERILPNATKYTVRIPDLPPGFYILKIVTERGTIIKKVGMNL